MVNLLIPWTIAPVVKKVPEIADTRLMGTVDFHSHFGDLTSGRGRRAGLVGSALVLLALLAACNSADFGAPSDDERQPVNLTTGCRAQGEYEATDLELSVTGDAKTKVILEGEFCPQAPAQLRLLFLVDFSLSMYNKDEKRGNDQVVNGSCGRLDAIKAIIDRHKDNLVDRDTEIEVGFIPFSTEVVDEVPLKDLDDVDENLTADELCRGVQFTNYKAAFDAARERLEEANGTKVIYFISDGLPTIGGDDDRGLVRAHRDAAVDSAKKLRSEINKLTFNTIFLGSVDDLDIEYDPQEFLEEMTGDAKRVKITDEAGKLAEEILSLERPPADLDTGSVSATVQTAGGETRKVTLEEFNKASNTEADAAWSFRTAPFSAFDETATKSTITISADDKDGDTYAVSFTIEGKPEGTVDE